MKDQADPKRSFPVLTWPQAALIVFLGAAGFFLWAEHKAHILGWLPYLILLLCPLMHIFMHKGHGDHGKDGDHNKAGEGHKH